MYFPLLWRAWQWLRTKELHARAGAQAGGEAGGAGARGDAVRHFRDRYVPIAYVPIAYEPDWQGVLTAVRVLVLTAVAVLFGDWLMAHSAKGPWHSPHHWWFTAAVVATASGSLVAVNAMGRT